MSFQLLILFAMAMMALILGETANGAAELGHLFGMALLGLFGVLVAMQGIRKPVV